MHKSELFKTDFPFKLQANLLIERARSPINSSLKILRHLSVNGNFFKDISSRNAKNLIDFVNNSIFSTDVCLHYLCSHIIYLYVYAYNTKSKQCA